MASDPPELYAHKLWIGQIEPVGLVVSAHVLVRHGVFVDRYKTVETQTRLRERFDEAIDFETLTREVLEWPDGLLAGAPGGAALPADLTIALPDYNDTLSPTYAVLSSSPGRRSAEHKGGSPADYLALVVLVPGVTDLDRSPADHGGWRASPHARLERLLRETGVPIGLLFNGTSLRLIYSPRGESSGHLTFRFAHLTETLGRPMVGALDALLRGSLVSGLVPEEQQLPALLRESRKYQNDVSTRLADQVLEALWELLRGFQRADDDHDSKGDLLREWLRDEPRDVYGGLLSTLMRLVFVLYAEDRGLMPASDVYQRHYSVSGLFHRLREDQARYPDTMDARYGAWAQLLSLFRLIFAGGSHGELKFQARLGRLFNPDSYPFLEGRPPGSAWQPGAALETPRVPDGTVFRVLQNLLVLDGERLSYRSLDVEQIGSVYEAMMGFALGTAAAPTVALSPKHIVVNLDNLLELKGKDRAAWLKEHAETKVSGDALGKATTVPELLAALASRISRYTPQALKPGAMYLQPTEERRRSGSHYTPRSLTEPIVRTTFRPILERLGEQATPAQILDLKVCDPAMGSGAFLVEACRLLGDRLVKAWETHKRTPKVPDDEDVWTYARRIVAERCLYGVDKNIFAVDLAKLSLWLATLAKDHPFTFLDHALRHGDSLVGLSREQIACIHWKPKQLPLVRSLLDARVAEAQRLREQLQSMGASDDVPEKTRLLREADEAVHDVRLIGDAVISAFFDREKPKERETLRIVYASQIASWLQNGTPLSPDLIAARDGLREGEHAIPAFHWEVEYPEVFTRANGGFDVFIGNPPFAGKNTIAAANREHYLEWLLETHEASHGNADLVAHFYRRAFDLLRKDGTFGLIATNTIAQGDTRGTGLRWIRQHGGTIYAARKRVKWPSAAAAVIVSVVHVAKGELPAPYDLDGRLVDLITAFLFHAGADDDPARLAENANKSFQGSIVLGMGFTFDDTDKSETASSLATMDALIRKDPRNAERIFPYIGGEEVNDSPTHSHHRYVINFGQMSEVEARRWPDLMAIVEAKVKPERVKLGDNPDAKRRKKFWWQWGRYTPALFEAIRGLDRVLAICRHQPEWAVGRITSNAVFAESLVLVASGHLSNFVVLQSRLHEVWARLLGSSMKDDLRYTPSDCFETFPFPEPASGSVVLDHCGAEYYEFRAGLMVRNNEGLTKTYNRFHDPDEQSPDIAKLRELHDAMDRAVLDAYDWTDIRPTCQFLLDYEDEEDDVPGKASKKRKPWRYRWPDDIRDEVLARLLALNAGRSASKSTASPISSTRGRPKTSAGTLFG